MIKRAAEPAVRRLLRGFPVVTITGPRQSGKTTLARLIFASKPYVSLEDPDERLAALEDPRGFLSRFSGGAVLDEVQRAPDLISYLQGIVDRDPGMGRFILTGSQQFGLMSHVSQSLAGRSAFVELLPFSFGELQSARRLPGDVDAMLHMGGYPALYDREITPREWFSAYMTSYVERDIRQLLQVQNLDTFQRFVRLCAGRSGQLLNLSSLANECGITHNTAKAWISVLEASYVVFLLRPHHANFNKRLVKTPKLYFHDTGFVCWLLGIQSPTQLETHPLRGSIFETRIVSEIVKLRFNAGERLNLYFWRDSTGNEIDLLVDNGTYLTPIEIKSGATVTADFFSGLNKWRDAAGDICRNPVLVYGGKGRAVRDDVLLVGWDEVSALEALRVQ